MSFKNILRVALIWTVIAFDVVVHCKVQQAVYHNQWGVHIPEGDAVAEELAAKHGFINRGQVSFILESIKFTWLKIHNWK